MSLLLPYYGLNFTYTFTQFLCNFYAIFMQFLCNFYAIFMQFLCNFMHFLHNFYTILHNFYAIFTQGAQTTIHVALASTKTKDVDKSVTGNVDKCVRKSVTKSELNGKYFSDCREEKLLVGRRYKPFYKCNLRVFTIS